MPAYVKLINYKIMKTFTLSIERKTDSTDLNASNVASVFFKEELNSSNFSVHISGKYTHFFGITQNDVMYYINKIYGKLD
jgi:hypothetical protein